MSLEYPSNLTSTICTRICNVHFELRAAGQKGPKSMASVPNVSLLSILFVRCTTNLDIESFSKPVCVTVLCHCIHAIPNVLGEHDDH